MSEKSVFDQYLDGCAPLTEIAKAAARGNARRDEAMTPTEPVAEAGGVLDALKLAEDVLSRVPFSTQLWPNGMHPNEGIEIIRKALRTAPATSGDLVLVPREPTPDMNIAGGIAWAEALPTSETYVDCAYACYKAMIEKAPATSAPETTRLAGFASTAGASGGGPVSSPASSTPAPAGDVGELVERLRLGASKSHDVGSHLSKYQALCDEAADLLVSLNSRLAELAEQLHYANGTCDLAMKGRDEAEARVAELEKALRFYADPFSWQKLHDPDLTNTQIPDFYREMDFGRTAIEVLSPTEPVGRGG